MWVGSLSPDEPGKPGACAGNKIAGTKENMTAQTEIKLEGDTLVIRLPIKKPLLPSSSGKTLLVASTNGNMATSVIIEGKPVIVGVNAYIKK